MDKDLINHLDKIEKRLLNVDELIKQQGKEILELRGSCKKLYEELYKKKVIIDKYKEKCPKMV